MNQQEHLDRVLSLFLNWRAERKPRQRIPDDLWAEALGLSKSIGMNQACQKLRLNQMAFKRYRERVEGESALHSQPQEFLEVSQTALPPKPFRAEISLEMKGGHRLNVRLENSDEKSVAYFLRQLMVDS